MKLFAPNFVVAKSRFWYFLRQQSKIKKGSGEIVQCKEVRKLRIATVFGILYPLCSLQLLKKMTWYRWGQVRLSDLTYLANVYLGHCSTFSSINDL